ncbi:N-acetyltransferase eso1 [Coemansia spiralis]|uniref:DNA polymerase eta n=1 Tax=Coemansia spiralis TaxID=417178 RepID=A0A9W8GB52_9FUNG|nr:N-acetyltransferase eso1 [Coemansia spiralis]
MDTAREAREKCPELTLVHVATFSGTSPPAYHPSPSANTHKVSLDAYRRASRQIMDVIKRICPNMRKASIDEAYLDVTAIVNDRILSDFGRGLFEWVCTEEAARADDAFLNPTHNSGSVLPLPTPLVHWMHLSRKGKEKEPVVTNRNSIATEYGLLVGQLMQTTTGWNDLQLKYAAELANHIRNTVYQELGYRTSAGVAHNRFLAKIGSGLNKPNQQTVFLQSQVAEFMKSFPISNIPMLGGKLGQLVEYAFDAQTAGDIMDYTLDQLSVKLGPDQALLLYNRCRGVDDSPVIDNSEPQSITSAKNFSRYPVNQLDKLDRWISMNSTDLWMRVVEEWDMRKRWPRSLTITYSTSGKGQRTKTIAFPSRHVQGMQSSPDSVVNAARLCLAAIAAGDNITSEGAQPSRHNYKAQSPGALFPLVGFSLTAKSFQRELAGASIMEKWLSKSRVSYQSPAEDSSAVETSGFDPNANSSSSNSSEASISDNGGIHNGGYSVPVANNAEILAPSYASIPTADIQQNQQQHHHQYLNQGLYTHNSQITYPQASQSIPHHFSNPSDGTMPQTLAHMQVQAQAQQAHHAPFAELTGHPQEYMGSDYAQSDESVAETDSASPSSAPTPPHAPNAPLFAGAASSAAPYVSHMFARGNNVMSALYEDDVQTPLPPLDPPRARKSGQMLGFEYETSDSDTSYLKTPREKVGEEDGGVAEAEGSEERIEDGMGEPEEAINTVHNAVCGSSNAYKQEYDDPWSGQEASGSKTKGKQAARMERPHGHDAQEHDLEPPSRATTVSSRRRHSVYIQSNVDLDSAARYGEGYKNMSPDKQDDGSLVVATPDEAQGAGDGFMPALIAATRRKREIQIFRFQNPVDAPEGAISGPRAGPGPRTAALAASRAVGKASSRASSNRHSRNSSVAGSTSLGEPSFVATVRTMLEDINTPAAIAEEESGAGNQSKEESSSGNEESDDGMEDLVLDIAVNAMMESISASQAVMQIRCPQCPPTAPTVSSQEWEMHRDWHIARHLQERELRHDQVAQQIQRAFVSATSTNSSDNGVKGSNSQTTADAEKPATKRARHDEAATSKRRQQTISEAWK